MLVTREERFVSIIVIAVMVLFCGTGRTSISAAELKYREHEKLAYMKAGFAEASLYQQSYIQLIAPDVQLQLQNLADEIAVHNGVDMGFRVHVVNACRMGTFSTGSGDIFIPMCYLDMVENRDEIAFCLAREIAIQHRLIHLRDWEESYMANKRYQMISNISGLVVSTVIHTAFNHYVYSPIHGKIMEKIFDPEDYIYPYMYMDKNLQRSQTFKMKQDYKQMSSLLGAGLGPLTGWFPSLMTNKSLKMVSHLIKISYEEADAAKRKRKNDLGLTYMGVAGFDPEAGYSVIQKVEEWKSDMQTKK